MTARSDKPKRVRRSPPEARRHILDAAEQVLARLGPDRTGLKEIAAEADVSHGLVTHYFGSIDSVIEHVLERQMVGIRDAVVERMRTEGAGWAEVLELVFDELSAPLGGRLLAWSFLSGRSSRTDFFARRNAGMRLIADAVASAEQIDQSQRLELEARIMVVACAALGYAAAGPVLWEAMGRNHGSELDGVFRRLLLELEP